MEMLRASICKRICDRYVKNTKQFLDVLKSKFFPSTRPKYKSDTDELVTLNVRLMIATGSACQAPLSGRASETSLGKGLRSGPPKMFLKNMLRFE